MESNYVDQSGFALLTHASKSSVELDEELIGELSGGNVPPARGFDGKKNSGLQFTGRAVHRSI